MILYFNCLEVFLHGIWTFKVMNIEINKFQIIQFIKMCSNNFKPTVFLTDVRNKTKKIVCERTKNNYCCVNGS